MKIRRLEFWIGVTAFIIGGLLLPWPVRLLLAGAILIYDAVDHGV